MKTRFVCRLRVWRSIFSLLAGMVLVGCSMPDPDGLEATLIEQTEGLVSLSEGTGRSPEAVVRNALLLDPDIRAAASAVSASADDVRIQRAALFPSLGLSITGGLGDAAVDEASLELRMRQLVLDFGNTDRAVTAADLDMQIAYIAFQQSVDDGIFDTLEAYDDVLKQVRVLNVWTKQLNALRSLHKLVTEQTKIGAVPASDSLETLKRLRAAEFKVHDSKLLLAEARDRISQLTGQPKGGAVPFLEVGDCTSPDDADETRKARLELARAQLDLQSAQAARKPRIYVEPVLRRKQSNGTIRAGIDVGVNSDLLQGGALTAAVNSAEDTLEAADATVAASRRMRVLDQNRLKREIAAGSSKVHMLKRQIELLEETRVLFRSQYLELGSRRVAELLENEEELYSRQAELAILYSDLVEFRLECAIREDRLRTLLGIDQETLYSFPLSDQQF